MSGRPPLDRRKISRALQERRGWLTKTAVDGYVLVRPRSGPRESGFAAEVRAEVEAMGYIPSVSRFTDSAGTTWVRVKTPETVAQDDGGRHA